MLGRRVSANTTISAAASQRFDFSFTELNDTSMSRADKRVADLAGGRGNSVEKLFAIIHEDTELLVINKPAGLVCHPTKTDAYSSLISRVRLYLNESTKPHLINRLDRETSGVVLIAKQDPVARDLRRIWETR